MTYDPGPICQCGHPKNSHAMDMRSHQCVGKCFMIVRRVPSNMAGQRCSCEQFAKKADAVSEMDE